MDAKKVVRVITNKYFITGVGFVAWVLFFDQNDYMSLQQRQRELDGVKGNIAYLSTEIARMDAEKNALTENAAGNLNNPAKLEQYAREHFRMKQNTEDIYVIDKQQ
jgi:cell division protein DivIC